MFVFWHRLHISSIVTVNGHRKNACNEEDGLCKHYVTAYNLQKKYSFCEGCKRICAYCILINEVHIRVLSDSTVEELHLE